MSQKLIEWAQPEVDGAIDLIYGGLGSGKTYAATADILRSLSKGIVVFATWPINFNGIDERESLKSVVLGILGLKKRYKVIDRSNFHYVPLEKMMNDEFINDIEKLTDVELYVDEGYATRLFDSYRKTNLGTRQRLAIYGTRHFNRRIIIVAQRPNAIHVSSRAMVNRFYKCERPFPLVQRLLHVIFFVKTEYQDMIDETVNEEEPSSTKWYFGSSRVFKAYDSKYLRAGAAKLYPSNVQVYKISWFSRVALLFKGLHVGRRGLKPAPASPVVSSLH